MSTTNVTTIQQKQHWSSTEQGISAYLVYFCCVLGVCLVLSKVLHHHLTWFPEAGMIIIVGMAAGGIVTLFQPQNDDSTTTVADGLLSFDPQVFFVFLLPPIIFNSGYHLRRELFVRHITPITLLAVVGTTVSALIIAGLLYAFVDYSDSSSFNPSWPELVTFGALISATDPVSTLVVFSAQRVDPQLFYLVFGESVLNDAVGIVLFQVCSGFVEKTAGGIVWGMSDLVLSFGLDAVGSPLLGTMWACGAAYLFKVVDLRQHGLVELTLYILIIYLPFLSAELLHLSGIVAILFTGMAARAYVVPNLSPETAQHAQMVFRLAAHLAETSIFLELGMSAVGGLVLSSASSSVWQPLFGAFAIAACLIARFCHVYPIAWAFNKWLREKTPDDAEVGEWKMAVNSACPGTVGCGAPVGCGPSGVFTELNETPLRDSDHHRDAVQQQMNNIENTGATVQPNSPMKSPKGTLSNTLSMDTTTPKFRRDLKIPPNVTHMICWFAGLRGAVAYACVRSFPSSSEYKPEFIRTTMLIILFTIFAMGSTTSAALKWLKIERNVDEAAYMEDWHRTRRSVNAFVRFEAWVQQTVVRQPDSQRHLQVDTTLTTEQVIDHRSNTNTPSTCIEMTDHHDLSTSMNSTTSFGAPSRESLFDIGRE